FVEGRESGGPLIARSTVIGVLISGVTTMVGFGSLMLAAHRGIFGLGLLLTLGTASSLLASLVVLPGLLRMVQQMRTALVGRQAVQDAEAQVPTAPSTERIGRPD